MGMVSCNDDQYTSQDNRCCDRCPAGTHVRNDCDGTKKTECRECVRGFYTATRNHLSQCKSCRVCSSRNHQRTLMECSAVKDTQCECLPGYYCNEQRCELCRPVTLCHVGEGVKIKATRMNDTICAPCEEGTYSNVSDSHSACLTHTRCSDLGRKLGTPGTAITDAVCGPFESQCHWILPASLWSGLVLTSLILLVIFCIFWRVKRKSYRTARSSVTDVPVALLPKVDACPVELPLHFTAWNGHCQESCEEKGCELTLYDPDDKMVSYCTQDSMESSLPRTPLTATVQFAESNHINGNAVKCTGNSLRAHSEPQEDEWCGT